MESGAPTTNLGKTNRGRRTVVVVTRSPGIKGRNGARINKTIGKEVRMIGMARKMGTNQPNLGRKKIPGEAIPRLGLQIPARHGRPPVRVPRHGARNVQVHGQRTVMPRDGDLKLPQALPHVSHPQLVLPHGKRLKAPKKFWTVSLVAILTP